MSEATALRDEVADIRHTLVALDEERIALRARLTALVVRIADAEERLTNLMDGDLR